MMKVLVLCFVAALWLQLPSGGDADCCPAVAGATYPGVPGQCGDCSNATPYCGYGGCNIFGCACDGGCRRGSCGGKRALSPNSDANDVIRAADLNGDGKMSIREAHAHVVRETGQSQRSLHGHLERSLRAMDVDNDNYISAREIDADAQ